LVGCGGAYSEGYEEGATQGGEVAPQPMLVQPEEAALIDNYPREMDDLAIQLDEAMPMTSALDCDAADRIKDRICELAGRICSIAERHPADESVGEKCTDGQARCERATNDVANRCG
jgi:hypothetical protein